MPTKPDSCAQLGEAIVERWDRKGWLTRQGGARAALTLELASALRKVLIDGARLGLREAKDICDSQEKGAAELGLPNEALAARCVGNSILAMSKELKS
jgi:hypothetical protein